MGLGHFYKHFVQNTREKDPAGKTLEVFSPRYPQNDILNGKFNSKMDIFGAFFTKSGHFSSIIKTGQRRGLPSLPAPSCATVGYHRQSRMDFFRFCALMST